MDFTRLWTDAIERVLLNSTDKKEQAIIQLFSTQVGLKVDGNKIRFLCGGFYIYNVFSHYATMLFAEICHILGRQETDLGLSVEVGFDTQSAPIFPPGTVFAQPSQLNTAVTLATAAEVSALTAHTGGSPLVTASAPAAIPVQPSQDTVAQAPAVAPAVPETAVPAPAPAQTATAAAPAAKKTARSGKTTAAAAEKTRTGRRRTKSRSAAATATVPAETATAAAQSTQTAGKTAVSTPAPAALAINSSAARAPVATAAAAAKPALQPVPQASSAQAVQAQVQQPARPVQPQVQAAPAVKVSQQGSQAVSTAVPAAKPAAGTAQSKPASASAVSSSTGSSANSGAGKNTPVIGVNLSAVSSQLKTQQESGLSKRALAMQKAMAQLGGLHTVSSGKGTALQGGAAGSRSPRTSSVPGSTGHVPMSKPRFLRQNSINQHKTFENYVTDPDNKLLVDTAMAVAANPGDANYNPLYIYGASGLGKTHLLFAIANRIRQNKPDCSLIYIRAEEFIRHYVDSMARGKKAPFDNSSLHFQDLYTGLDVFIVDDVQNFVKGTKARDAFFEIIADFIDRPDGQLILASDVPPGNLTGFSSRLTSRFGSGVCCEVLPPSAETRAAIVRKKAAESGLVLEDGIIAYIAANISSNVREIEGAVKTLFIQHKINGSLTFDDATRVLSSLVNTAPQQLSIDDIKARVAEEFEITQAVMESAARKKNISNARSLAMTLSRDLIGCSLNEIARAFNKDHSTVHEAISRMRKKLHQKEYADLQAVYQKLKQALRH